MKLIAKAAAFIAAALAAAFPSSSQAVQSTVSITDAWFRMLPAGLPAGAYFTLHNGSGKVLALKAADSPACGMLMLHKSDESSGMASMSDVERIDVPPGSTFKFAPGGYHLMCMSPTALLKIGTSAPVTLHFADGSKITAAFAVKSATGK